MLASLLLALGQAPLDVVVFILDDVSSSELALYGGPVPCPNLEALAARGVTFERCYANATCSPSRRSILTGRYWAGESDDPCPGSTPGALTPGLAEVFLPEALPRHASGLFGKWHVGPHPLGAANERAPIVHGFDVWLAGQPTNVNRCGGGGYTNWLRVDAQPGWHRSATSHEYEPIAVRAAFVAGWPDAASPKLAVVASNLAHGPFRLPPARLLPPGYVPLAGARGRYEAMIVAWDTLLGQMLATIDLRTTLVIVVGDNGSPDNVAADPLRAKGTTFEGGVRVPLVIGGGATLAGRITEELVHVADVWATAIEAGGEARPATSLPTASVSLVPILTGRRHAPLHELILVGHGWGGPDGQVASVSASGIKLRWVDGDGDRVADLEELYDLAADPLETVDRVADPNYALDLAKHRAFLRATAQP